jgi:hypothetical protein
MTIGTEFACSGGGIEILLVGGAGFSGALPQLITKMRLARNKKHTDRKLRRFIWIFLGIKNFGVRSPESLIELRITLIF